MPDLFQTGETLTVLSRRETRSGCFASDGFGVAGTSVTSEIAASARTAGAPPIAGTVWVGAINRYPRRVSVSTNRGLSAESLRAWRSLLTDAFRPCSKFTNVSAGQSFW